jgi:hypothetical protein
VNLCRTRINGIAVRGSDQFPVPKHPGRWTGACPKVAAPQSVSFWTSASWRREDRDRPRAPARSVGGDVGLYEFTCDGRLVEMGVAATIRLCGDRLRDSSMSSRSRSWNGNGRVRSAEMTCGRCRCGPLGRGAGQLLRVIVDEVAARQ